MTTRFKSLVLQGYKTFAHRTRFEFPLPITAIVGPNGSGKSNIADAIRWVLGEQSYSLLRGRKTMDMIFTGSDQKARAGMASVSIQFDNQDEWLPIDYEEVEISRRAYRSGENEYQVNGQRVRLKDINELLGQSGLAERSYTIIGQGMIDSALSLKPDDRRRFFEEAAGIGLFRSRREEALDRLEKTQRNLERISDILGELEPRLHSLQRQSKRAVEYEQIKKDLTVLLKDWYGYHWHKAQQALLNAMSLSEVQSGKTIKIQQESAVLENNATQLLEAIKEKRQILGDYHNQLADYHHRMDENNRESAILDERLTAAQRQALSFSDEAELIQAEIALLEERREKIQGELAELQAASESAKIQKEQLEAELAAQQAELTSLQQERSKTRSALVASETAMIQLKARRDEAVSQLESLTESSRSLSATLQESDNALATLREKQSDLQNQLQQAEEELAKIDLEQTDFQTKVRDLEKQKTDVSNALNEKQAAFARANAKHDVLNQAEKNLTGLNQGAQFLLKNAGKNNLQKEFTSLSSCFIFPQELEIAAAAVLGESLDAILLERNDWEKAASLLAAGDNGRATLIAEKFDTEGKALAPDKSISALASLAGSVSCDAAHKPLADRLFSSAYIVESHDQALTLQPRLQAGELLVSRQGSVFHANGSVTTGRENRHQVLSRKREMTELKRQLDSLRSEIAGLQSELKLTEQNLQNSRKQFELGAKKRQQQSQTHDLLRKNLNQVSMETQKKEQLSSFQKQRIQENEQRGALLTAKISESEKEISQIEAGLSVQQETFKSLTDAMNAIQLDELQQQAHHWSLEWTVSEKSLTDAERRITDLSAQIERNRQRASQNQQKSEASGLQIEEITRQILALQENNTSSEASAREIEDQMTPVESELKDLQQQVERLQSDQQQQQVRSSAAEKQLLQQQMEVTRLNDQLETLKQRIEDDFGLVAFEYREKIAGQSPLPLGEMVAELPMVESLPENIKDQISRLKGLMHRMGAINPDAIEEYQSVNERYHFLLTQSNDLKAADKDLREVIAELDEMMKTAFQQTFEKVQVEFREMFTRLFGGGAAKLVLTDPENINQSGIDIQAKLPGRREQELSLLSGGERSLTSVALVFALLRVSPTPFCVLDEVDAALDEANVGRFCELLKDLSRDTQFIVITHNRNTVEIADVIYGITMGRDSSSQVVSLRLDEINKEYLS